MRDRLIELLRDAANRPCGTKCCYESLEPTFSGCITCFADHLLADGWIRLPLKVGDVVYTNIKGVGLMNSFRVNSVDLLGFSNGIYSWTWHQLGKSVFRTPEEAENAL